jgi:hypothetical protein
MLDQNKEHQIILNFGPDTHRDGAMKVHACTWTVGLC